MITSRELGDPLAAAIGELRQAVLLDLALRVEAERALHLHLHPQALAVEPVLVALVEAALRLVALEDVLQRPAPGVMNAHRVVRRDRPVDEAEARAAAVLLPEALERRLRLPAREHLALEGWMVRDRRKWRERAWHQAIIEFGNRNRRPAV